MTRRSRIWINVLFATVFGPLLALSLLIPLPLNERMADRAFGRLIRKLTGERVWTPWVGRFDEQVGMETADIVYVLCSDLDAGRKWELNFHRFRLLPRHTVLGERPRNSVLLYVGPNWFRGDRVYYSTLAYGSGNLGMHGAVVFLQRSWLGPWFIAYSTWIS
ncbi:MAG: hypothetical protein GXP31_03380 [Kiritimatiellaeota bacterium]|nr:hypothetical protein [Kiritimatiellota bacterium]